MSLPLRYFPAWVFMKWRDGLLNRQESKNRLSALDPLPHLYANHGITIEQDIHARTELDEAYALAASHMVSYFEIENYAAGDKTGDLFKDYGASVALDGDDVLLILFRGVGAHGVQKFSLLIMHVADYAGNGRTIYVHIEDVEKNADPQEGFFVHGNR